MSTNIYQYNGSLLVTVADGVLNSTAAPIQIPGKGYTNYGAPVIQDILWTMQNFAGSVSPSPPLTGMCWYDTNTNQLKVYNGTSFFGVFKENQDNIPSSDNTYDLGSASYRFGTLYSAAVVSSSITGDPNLYYADQTNLPAANNTYNLGSSSYKYATIYTTTLSATTVNASTITGDPTIMRTNSTNLPTVDNTYNLGSSSYKYANMYATTFNGVATSAEYADVAERYASDEVLEVGDVVKIGGDAEITKTTSDADTNVFGVISDKPALKMNDKAGKDDTHPLVALLGRTPVKLRGPIAKGQRVVSSDIPGIARAASGEEPDLAILGRALVAKQSDEIELVEIVIGRH